MEAVERRLQRTAKGQKTQDKALIAEDSCLKALHSHLEAGKSARSFTPANPDHQVYIDNLNLLTAKPVLYAANVAEDDLADGNAYVSAVQDHATGEGSEVFVVSASVEQEIAELDDADRQEFLEALGISSGGLDRLIAASYKLLGLISYLTTGEKETRAWTITKGTKAPRPPVKSIPTLSGDLSAPKSSPTTTSFNTRAKPAHVKPANYAWKAKNTSFKTATSSNFYSTFKPSSNPCRQPRQGI